MVILGAAAAVFTMFVLIGISAWWRDRRRGLTDRSHVEIAARTQEHKRDTRAIHMNPVNPDYRWTSWGRNNRRR